MGTKRQNKKMFVNYVKEQVEANKQCDQMDKLLVQYLDVQVQQRNFAQQQKCQNWSKIIPTKYLLNKPSKSPNTINILPNHNDILSNLVTLQTRSERKIQRKKRKAKRQHLFDREKEKDGVERRRKKIFEELGAVLSLSLF